MSPSSPLLISNSDRNLNISSHPKFKGESVLVSSDCFVLKEYEDLAHAVLPILDPTLAAKSKIFRDVLGWGLMTCSIAMQQLSALATSYNGSKLVRFFPPLGVRSKPEDPFSSLFLVGSGVFSH